ncbi:hypothetical protein [Cerasicoccus fimbriatus]|uniref:hypothetical protein n=1 Tax=Cerasicoccus fimbriatus TaxID=3014554 RepID=UPI0022B4413C|nr:hypothetical protein [Cerasicoccus sp. TK19100]
MEKLLSKISILSISALAAGSAIAQTGPLSGERVVYSYTPGAGVEPPYFVSQSLSSGQVAKNISEGGVFDPENTAVKWGPFNDTSTVELSFDVVGNSVSLGTLTATDGDGSTVINPAASSAPTNPFLVWREEKLPQRLPAEQAIDANIEGDVFPNFAEYLLGFDPLVRETVLDALSIQPNGTGGYEIAFNRMQGNLGFQAIIERVNLDTGEVTPLATTETRPGPLADMVTEVFSESAAPFFVRMRFVPFEPEPEVEAE